MSAEYINPNADGAWFAYYSDFSGFAVFADELQCCRYALKLNCQVAKVPLGVDAREHIQAQR